jgi:ribonuclease HI
MRLVMNKFETVILNFDGSSKPNPGEMTSAYVIRDINDKLLNSRSIVGGHGTSNEAEYIGLYEGLKKVVELGYKHVEVYGDSQLVIFQVKSEFKCRKAHLVAWRDKILELLKQVHTYKLTHVKRQFNKEADALCRT